MMDSLLDQPRANSTFFFYAGEIPRYAALTKSAGRAGSQVHVWITTPEAELIEAGTLQYTGNRWWYRVKTPLSRRRQHVCSFIMAVHRRSRRPPARASAARARLPVYRTRKRCPRSSRNALVSRESD